MSGTAQDPLEEWLLRIWQQLLGSDRLSLDDDFFELGGRSLDAARLFAAIHRRHGIDLPVSTLVDARTVRQLSALLRSRRAAPRPTPRLVTVRAEGTRPPLIVVHGLRGNALFAKPIAEQLGTDQPVFAVESDLLSGGPAVLKTVEDIAESYAQLVHNELPAGPILLFGNSFGGLIALEMAARLPKLGRDVILLAVGDTFLAGPMFTRLTGRNSLRGRAALHRRRLAGAHPGSARAGARARAACRDRGTPRGPGSLGESMRRIPLGTPGRSPDGEVEVWTVDLNHTDEAAWILLSREERDRAARFRSARHTREYIASHAALRRIVGDRMGVAPSAVRFGVDPNGRPVLIGSQPLRFNLSRTDGLAVCALGRGCDVGVDVEAVHAFPGFEDRLLRRVCTQSELDFLASLPEPQRARQFLHLWVRKEAVVKLDGRGLALSLREVPALDVQGVVDLDVGAKYVAALATSLTPG